MHYELTAQQKLAAMAMRFYDGIVWKPQKGDYYTSSRNDLELYRVVDVRDGKVFTEYCASPGSPVAEWPEDEFTTDGFGIYRVWVYPAILDT